MISNNGSLLEPLWSHLLKHYSHILEAGWFVVALPIGFYTFLCCVCLALDIIPYFRRFKIQKTRPVTLPDVWKALKCTAYNNLVYISPLLLIQILFMPPTYLPPTVPLLKTALLQILFLFIVFDASYWAWHVYFHKWKWGFTVVHAVHHEYHSPFGFVTQYLHPIELFSTSILSTIPPLLLGVHPLIGWTWQLISIYISVEAHSGFDFPWGLHNIIPGYGGVLTHDLHHQKPTTNYQPFLTYLDYYFNTAALRENNK